MDELTDYCVALANEGGGGHLGVTNKRPRKMSAPGLHAAGADFARARPHPLRIDFSEVNHPHGRVPSSMSIPACRHPAERGGKY